MTLPKQYRGSERTAVERFVVVEELLAISAPDHAGRAYFGIGISEPDSGSDLAWVRTIARRVGDR